MADPVLRIPIDDAAFQRYMEAFERYQEQLREQPNMWSEVNSEILDGVSANLALADAIGASVSAAVRLGDVQNRNAQQRKREAENSDAEEQRAAGWRQKALDHVQQLGRSASSVVRSFGNFAAGGSGTGGLFGMLAGAGKSMGGEVGELTALVGHVLNAGYEINNAVADKGLFARGIGATLGQQEGFHNNLGRYTNTDQGLDAVMNARGTPSEWWQFNALGVDRTKGSNADVYGNVLRSQAALARRYTDKNGVTNWAQVDPRGGSAFGTTHEDLNRLKGLTGSALDKAIRDAVTFKTPLEDKQIDAAIKTVTAMDNNTQKLTDLAQAMTTGLNPAMDKVTQGLNSLTDVMTKIYNLFSFNWFGQDNTVVPQTGPTTTYGPGSDHALNVTGPSYSYGPGTGNAPPPPVVLQKPRERVDVDAPASDAAPAGNAVPVSMSSTMQVARSMGWRVTSDTRTYAEQARLYRKYRAYVEGRGPWAPLAARPGHSAHESGHAMDIGYGPGITRQSIASELRRRGVHVTRVLNEGNHYHVEWAPGAQRTSSNGRHGTSSQNVQVAVRVSAPPGHQTAVTTNSVARG